MIAQPKYKQRITKTIVVCIGTTNKYGKAEVNS